MRVGLTATVEGNIDGSFGGSDGGGVRRGVGNGCNDGSGDEGPIDDGLSISDVGSCNIGSEEGCDSTSNGPREGCDDVGELADAVFVNDGSLTLDGDPVTEVLEGIPVDDSVDDVIEGELEPDGVNGANGANGDNTDDGS